MNEDELYRRLPYAHRWLRFYWFWMMWKKSLKKLVIIIITEINACYGWKKPMTFD